MEQVIEISAATLTERRISWLTLVIGAAAALATLLSGYRLWAAGLMAGAALAWLNFRWLRRGLDGLVQAATAQAGHKKPRVPMVSYLLALLRYALIGLAAYVIFAYIHVPLASIVIGLCALGAAAIGASVYEVWRPAA